MNDSERGLQIVAAMLRSYQKQAKDLKPKPKLQLIQGGKKDERD